jgi:hypothetical protein
VLKSAGALTTIGRLSSPIAQTLRDVVGHLALGLGAVQHAFADNMTMVSVGYPDSPLNGSSFHGAVPKPGQRLAPIAEQTAPGTGPAPRFTLIAEASAPIAALVRQFEALVDEQIRPPLHDGGLWLVRPDGYVACAAKNADDVATYLRRLQ